MLTEALVLRDPDVPSTGNPEGEVNIVEWFDYNCPYCRKIAPEIQQVVQDDGKVRLVLKEWPILGEVSKLAARMAMAAKYQDKYLAAHEAMIGVSSKLTESRIRDLLEIQPGDRLFFESQGQEVRIRVVPKRQVADFLGAFETGEPFPGKEVERQQTAESLARRHPARRP